MDKANIKLIKILLDRDFYDENKHRIVREMFPDEIAKLYDTILEGHTRYERDLSVDDIRALHKILNPTLTRAQLNNANELLFDVEQETPFEGDISRDILSALWKEEVSRQGAEIFVDCMNGKIENPFMEIQSLMDRHSDDFLPIEDVVELDNDLEGLLERLNDRQSWRFNIPSLSRRIAGGAGGDFMIAFARPEAGKTAFHVSLACGPDGFCHQGANVFVLCNEEPGDRTSLRAISACTGMNKEALENNVSLAAEKWNKVRDKYHIIDTVDMTMHRLDAYCRRHKPDILIIDQLDKVHVTGSFARTDQKLREIYRLARETAKRHNVFVIGISQASVEAEGKTILTYAMMEESKTGKAAEADLIIGIGKRGVSEDTNLSSVQNDRQRHLTVSKNKITGWHGTVHPVLESEISLYHD